MTEKEIQRIAKDAAKEAIKEVIPEVLKQYGIDPNDTKGHQADAIFTRNLREGQMFMKKRVGATVIGVVIPAFLYLIWTAIKGN